MYLLPDVNMKLRPKILALKPGTRIVSHAFDMGDWKPDRTEVVDGATIHFWTVPSRQRIKVRIVYSFRTLREYLMPECSDKNYLYLAVNYV